MKTSILIGTFLVATATPSYAQANISVPIGQQVKEVVAHLVGVMDTSAQAKANPGAPNVRITTCQVQLQAADINRPQAVFLYQEQALTKQLNKPYRQRFLRIAPTQDNRQVESAAFRPLTPRNWIGLCSKPQQERVINKGDLSPSTCSVYLQRTDKNYVGETAAGGCPSKFRGAARITNRIILHQTGMDTLDRGYDAAGKQIWGAKEQPYQFRWLNVAN